ncbi:MAG: phosphatase PAP2 family protein [Comamonas sp.]|nr:phosphatase PAP2 family protein [Candidatus Comamonas equi]
MHEIDVSLFEWINATIHSPSWLLHSAALYSEYFPTLAISSMLLCLVFGTPALRRGVAWCLVAMLVSWCCTRLIRWGFPLERPYDLGLGVKWVEHSGRARFPSMHATVSFAFAAGMCLWCALGPYAKGWKILAWSVALLMGWSRIYIGVHLPFDVLGGLVVGAASVYMVQAARTRFRFNPRDIFAAYWSRRAGPLVRRK